PKNRCERARAAQIWSSSPTVVPKTALPRGNKRTQAPLVRVSTKTKLRFPSWRANSHPCEVNQSGVAELRARRQMALSILRRPKTPHPHVDKRAGVLGIRALLSLLPRRNALFRRKGEQARACRLQTRLKLVRKPTFCPKAPYPRERR